MEDVQPSIMTRQDKRKARQRMQCAPNGSNLFRAYAKIGPIISTELSRIVCLVIVTLLLLPIRWHLHHADLFAIANNASVLVPMPSIYDNWHSIGSRLESLARRHHATWATTRHNKLPLWNEKDKRSRFFVPLWFKFQCKQIQYRHASCVTQSLMSRWMADTCLWAFTHHNTHTHTVRAQRTSGDGDAVVIPWPINIHFRWFFFFDMCENLTAARCDHRCVWLLGLLFKIRYENICTSNLDEWLFQRVAWVGEKEHPVVLRVRCSNAMMTMSR